ncbi:GAF domain-containing protein [Kribbella orskensis]|uniref:GAF domain-containing protein n=1 Tax=Kribbella orskensis TaxID=2512216 RepID=A0ABY2B862_9ACTN|nr:MULTISPECIES: helix-turn-helix domain-containing protein [Kribbella]TCN30093.1 GAF domain-containing protein [Kribbella sp. VKM Ac-2500]TCO10267.1 GAF domain-containing protein [Kribbella orskensis]
MDSTLDDTPFLSLLARDASAEEYDEPLRTAVAEGASENELRILEQSKALALRVRRALEHRRRREIELEALFETAGDLAGLQDVDAVLQAIVRRARTLLHTDVAYLTLIDPDRGDTYMRATAGAVSASFRRVRLAMGAGLGGLVADTSTPYATDDYFADQRFEHVVDVDSAVSDEGLVAILGVPLLLGPQVLGVLFAADRSRRPFGRDEISLLCSLAAHAAISIDGARLLEEARAAVRELDAANKLVRQHSAAVERAAEAHDRFADLALRGGGVDEVAKAVTEVLGGDLTVLDPEEAEVPAGWREAIAASRGEGRAVCRGGTWFAAVVAGSEAFGALVLRGRADLEDADQRVLERAALVTALLQLMNRTAMETENRVRGELISDLVTNGERAGDGLRERARQVGFDLDGEFAVVVAQTDRERAHRLAFAASHLAAQSDGIAGLHQDRAVLLLPGEEAGAAARRMAKELAVAIGQPVTAGAAGPVSSPERVPGSYAESVRCLEALTALGRHGDGTSSRELGFIGVLLGESRGVEGFVNAVLGPVLEYDERRGTGLLQTLETYFANGGNLTRAKDDLHVHVNTVAQRLDRVSQLLGSDWQDAEPALEIQLALRLHRLVRS